MQNEIKTGPNQEFCFYKGESQIGKTINGLLILGFHSNTYEGKNKKNVRQKWNVQCSCGKKIVMKGHIVLRRKTDKCICHDKRLQQIKKSLSVRNNLLANEHQFHSLHSYFNRIKRQAKTRSKNLEFSVTIDDIESLWNSQKGVCALSGRKLDKPILSATANAKHLHNAGSIDRIDSSKGYIKGNIQWIHKDINRMKWDFSQKKFLKFCEEIVNHARC